MKEGLEMENPPVGRLARRLWQDLRTRAMGGVGGGGYKECRGETLGYGKKSLLTNGLGIKRD